MAKQKDFDAFLSNIEPSATTVSYISSVHNNLRDYLAKHSNYKDVHVHTFLSGSYAKHTCIRPKLYDGKRDVDIVVETNYDSNDNSIDVIQELLEVLLERNIYSNAELHSHSVGIELEGIEIDVVPVIRSDDGEIFCIGTSDINEWTLCDPKGHIEWSTETNTNSNKKYKPLVKMFKWWRRTNCPENVKYPKGLTLEKIIADNLPDSDLNTENYFIGAMQSIINAYQEDYLDKGILPNVSDPCLVENDLLANYDFSDFEAFVLKISEHLDVISQNEPTNETWRTILGTEFPSDTTSKSSFVLQGIQNALNVPHRQKPSWSVPRGAAVIINTQLKFQDGRTITIENDGEPIPKNCGLIYKALHSVKHPYHIKWQIVNTGDDAKSHSCLRGEFEDSNCGVNGRSESTSYTGKHYVQCFVIKKGQCVAKSKEFFINIV